MKHFYFWIVIAIMLVGSITTSCSSTGSDSVYGVWKEYRADDPSDDYLISQLRFNQDGTGTFTLLDGGSVRSKYSFYWEMDAMGNITTNNMDGSSSTFRFYNGLITENSAFGSIVYKKKTLF